MIITFPLSHSTTHLPQPPTTSFPSLTSSFQDPRSPSSVADQNLQTPRFPDEITTKEVKETVHAPVRQFPRGNQFKVEGLDDYDADRRVGG
jgi:hypothetical protein